MLAFEPFPSQTSGQSSWTSMTGLKRRRTQLDARPSGFIHCQMSLASEAVRRDAQATLNGSEAHGMPLRQDDPGVSQMKTAASSDPGKELSSDDPVSLSDVAFTV